MPTLRPLPLQAPPRPNLTNVATLRSILSSQRQYRSVAAGLLLLVGTSGAAYAAGTVGTGTAASCTEAALDTALMGGGTVTFKCGAAPVTITLTTQKDISATTSIDGAGLITLDANNAVRHFATSASAGLDLQRLSLIHGNGQAGVGGGGAVFAGIGTALTLTDVVADNNTAPIGGAIFVAGTGVPGWTTTLALTRVSMSANLAKSGGGAIEYRGTALTVAESLFASNTLTGVGSNGGAIEVNPFSPSTLSIVNSTFYNNGGNSAGGGGISITNVANGTINGSTLANNFGQGAIAILGNGTATTLRNTIISATAGNQNCYLYQGGTLTDGGNNLQFGGTQPNSCGASIPTADPQLGALANNGGPTKTMALAAGSSAIDGGNNATCSSIDQRSVARPIGPVCDIGAFEAPLAAVAPAITNGPPPGGTVGVPYSFTYIASGTTPITFVPSGSLPPGLVLSTSGTILGTPTAPGTYTGSVTAKNGAQPDATQAFTITIDALPAQAAVPAPALDVGGLMLLICGLLGLACLNGKSIAKRQVG